MIDIIDSFSGMNGLSDPSKLNKSELALLENFTLKSYGNVGSLVSRNGFTRYGDTQIAGGSGVGSAYESTLNGSDYIIANIINGVSSALYYKASPYTTGAWTAITGGGSGNNGYKLNYASFKDKVYIANRTAGASSNQVWDGTTAGLYDMGCPPCDTSDITLTPSNSAGTLTSNVQYMYIITFLYDGYQESGTQYIKFVTMGVADDTVTITNIPVSANTRCTARKIYRSKASASSTVPFSDVYYLATIGNNTTTTYLDETPDANLSEAVSPVTLFTLKKPFRSKYVVIHKERAVLANCIDGLLYASADTEFTLTPSNGAGALTSGTTYNYRFKKFWYTGLGAGANTGDGALYASAYTSKSVVMGVAEDTVTIAYTGGDTFVKYIAVERASAGSGSSDYQLVSILGWFWDAPAGNFTDITADGSRLSTPLPISIPTKTTYPEFLTVSDAGKPDLFSNIETAQDGTLIPASNEWNVGEPITGIHSEENRIIIFSANNIYELDTSSQSRQFWRLNKIVSGIGADDGLQVQCGKSYVFIKSNLTGSSKSSVYEWDGRSQPVVASLSIQSYLEDNRVTTVKSIVYDQYNNRVMFDTATTASINTAVFVYNLDLRDNNGLGKWEIWLNATDLNLAVGLNTKSYGVLWGNGDGYIHNLNLSGYQDVIAGTNRTFTTKLRTKTYESFDRDLKPRRLRVDMTTNGVVTPLLKTAVDGTLNSGDNMTATSSGTTFSRPNQKLFTNAQDKFYRQIYFQLEMTANVQQKVHGLMIDLSEKSEASGGR